MDAIGEAKLAVGAAYTRRYASTVTLELMASLEEENRYLRAEIALRKQRGRARSGRFVFARALSFVAMTIFAAACFYWFQYTREGYCARIGADKGLDGWAELKVPACKHDFHSIFSSPRTAEWTAVVDHEASLQR